MLIDRDFRVRPHERGGGRTTALMLEALVLMAECQSVVYLTLNWDQTEWCFHHFASIVMEPANLYPGFIPNKTGYNFTSRDTGAVIFFRPVDHHPMSLLTRQPPPSVLVDHYTEEATRGSGLAEWLYVAERRHLMIRRPY